jgi:hypothetical protein
MFPGPGSYVFDARPAGLSIRPNRIFIWPVDTMNQAHLSPWQVTAHLNKYGLQRAERTGDFFLISHFSFLFFLQKYIVCKKIAKLYI